MPSPLVTATLQAALLSSISNLLAQLTKSYQNQAPFTFNVYDFLRFVALTFLTTPPNYRWQQYLERTFPAYPAREAPGLPLSRLGKKGDAEDDGSPSRPRLSLKNTAAKWFIDCMTLGALLNTVAFLVLMGLMKRQSTVQISNTVQTQTLPLIWASYKVWPIVSILNFAFVPVERRIVVLSSVGLLWGVYMSLVAARV